MFVRIVKGKSTDTNVCTDTSTYPTFEIKNTVGLEVENKVNFAVNIGMPGAVPENRILINLGGGEMQLRVTGVVTGVAANLQTILGKVHDFVSYGVNDDRVLCILSDDGSTVIAKYPGRVSTIRATVKGGEDVIDLAVSFIVAAD